MKEKHHLSILFLFLLMSVLFFSCKKKASPIQENKGNGSLILQPKSVQGVAVPIDAIIDPYRMHIGEGLLYASCFSCDTMVYVFSLPDLTLLNSFGCKGNGPADFIFPTFTHATKDTVGIWGYADFKKIKEFKVNKKGQLTFLKEYKVKKNIAFNQLSVVNDSLLFHNIFPKELKIEKINLRTGESQTHGFEEDQNRDNFYFNQNKGEVRASGEHIAYLYAFKDRIDFFDLDFNLKHTYEGSANEAHIDTRDYTACFGHYRYSFAGDRYLYAINHNQKVGFRNDTACTLEIFTWDGRFVTKVQLKPSVDLMVVDEKNQQLYGYNQSMPDAFYRYDLKNSIP